MRKWLADLRNKKSYTQRKVSELVGITPEYYSMIESGLRSPSVDIAIRIAKALDFEWPLFFDKRFNETLGDD